MLPDQSLSSFVLEAPFLSPDGDVVSPLEDFEQGGVALNDPSQGLDLQVWKAYYDEDDETIYVEPANDDPIAVVTSLTDVIEVSLAFDQNMRPQLAWSTSTSSFFRWYDTSVAQQVITEYANEANLRLGLDDKRTTQTGTSDVILSYQRDGALYFRAQRDRYETEYLLADNLPGGRLLRVGMNEVNRFQWEFFPGADPADAVWPLGNNVWGIPAEAGFNAGERVGAWAEGHGFLGFVTITEQSGQQVITLDVPDLEGEDPTTELVIGYPYSAKFRPLPFAEPDQRGPMLGRKRRLVRAIFSVEDSVSLLANDVPVLQQTGESQARQLTPRTGEFDCRFLGWTTRDRLEVEAMSPYDATIRALVREYNQ